MIILCERATMLEWTCCKIVWDKGDLLCVCKVDQNRVHCHYDFNVLMCRTSWNCFIVRPVMA